jgi:hypothetical protein
MSSIIKVDQIQLADGSTPTAGDLGLNVTGSVLQVVQSTSTTSNATSSTAYSATSLNVTITPSSTSSSVLVLLNGCYDTDASGRQLKFALFRGQQNLSGGAEQSFSKPYNGGGRQIGTVSLDHLDSPNTTSATTYTLYFAAPAGDEVEFCSQSTQARIIAMEIAG